MKSSGSLWEARYANADPLTVSWYQKTPAISLELIGNSGVGTGAGIIDVGGGASVLVDYLLALDYRDLTVLDIAANALAYARNRLGEKAAAVDWVVGDVTRFAPSRRYDVWHDRAVLHFLTEAEDREKYVAIMTRALKPGGHVIIGAFAVGGPEKCSGLAIEQYDADKICTLLGAGYTLNEHREEIHTTPTGAEQRFVFFRFQQNA